MSVALTSLALHDDYRGVQYVPADGGDDRHPGHPQGRDADAEEFQHCVAREKGDKAGDDIGGENDQGGPTSLPCVLSFRGSQKNRRTRGRSSRKPTIIVRSEVSS